MYKNGNGNGNGNGGKLKGPLRTGGMGQGNVSGVPPAKEPPDPLGLVKGGGK